MSFKKKIASFAIVSALASSPMILAANPPIDYSQKPQIDNPWYVEGMGGFDRSLSNGAFGTDIGYQFYKNFSAELGTIYTTKDNKFDTYLAGKMSVPVNDKFSVFTKVGVGRQFSSSNKTVPMFGVGATYKLTSKTYLEGQWVRFINDDSQTTAPSFFLAGIGYKFSL
jgi:hypothetical protein